MTTVSHLRFAGTILLAMSLALTSLVAAASSKEDDRAKLRTQSQQVLERLYAAEPGARDAIAGSKGYATFSKWGLKLGAVGGGIGKGLAVSQPAGTETFMRFVEGSAGLGLGIKKYDLVFVFDTEQAYANFIKKGWQAGTHATFAAKAGDKGAAHDGAASVSDGVWVYLITEKGLAAEIGLNGTKYYQDKSLN